MKTILLLAAKDLFRDLKRPWGILILLSLPLVMATLMAWVFGRGGDDGASITLRVAVCDLDNDFFGGMLRSMGNQGGDDQRLQFILAETREEGLRMLENREASALLVLPEGMTANLLDGATAEIEIYPNPAESILPKAALQGADMFAAGVSEALRLMGPEIQAVRDWFESEEMPPSWTVAMMVYQGMQKMESLETYFFPPIVQFQTVPADEYIPMATGTAPSDNGGGGTP